MYNIHYLRIKNSLLKKLFMSSTIMTTCFIVLNVEAANITISKDSNISELNYTNNDDISFSNDATLTIDTDRDANGTLLEIGVIDFNNTSSAIKASYGISTINGDFRKSEKVDMRAESTLNLNFQGSNINGKNNGSLLTLHSMTFLQNTSLTNGNGKNGYHTFNYTSGFGGDGDGFGGSGDGFWVGGDGGTLNVSNTISLQNTSLTIGNGGFGGGGGGVIHGVGFGGGGAGFGGGGGGGSRTNNYGGGAGGSLIATSFLGLNDADFFVSGDGGFGGFGGGGGGAGFGGGGATNFGDRPGGNGGTIYINTLNTNSINTFILGIAGGNNGGGAGFGGGSGSPAGKGGDGGTIYINTLNINSINTFSLGSGGNGGFGGSGFGGGGGGALTPSSVGGNGGLLSITNFNLGANSANSFTANIYGENGGDAMGGGGGSIEIGTLALLGSKDITINIKHGAAGNSGTAPALSYNKDPAIDTAPSS